MDLENFRRTFQEERDSHQMTTRMARGSNRHDHSNDAEAIVYACDKELSKQVAFCECSGRTTSRTTSTGKGAYELVLVRLDDQHEERCKRRVISAGKRRGVIKCRESKTGNPMKTIRNW